MKKKTPFILKSFGYERFLIHALMKILSSNVTKNACFNGKMIINSPTLRKDILKFIKKINIFDY